MPLLQERVTVNIEKILLATDFCEVSEKATAYARALAQRFSSTVAIAHVFNPSNVILCEGAILGMPPEEWRQNCTDYLECSKTQFADAGLKVHTKSLQGQQAATELLKLVTEDPVDLIVIGTQSKQGLKRMLLGSTAEEIIRNAECPVLTVGPNSAAAPSGPLVFRSIVFATDFSREAAKAAAFALSLAQDSGAHLYLCHVVQSYPGWQREAPVIDAMFTASLAKMIPDSSYDWCSPECALEHGEAAAGILGLAERVHADLIVLGARHETFLLKHHVDHGVTPDLLAEATCPVLTVC